MDTLQTFLLALLGYAVWLQQRDIRRLFGLSPRSER